MSQPTALFDTFFDYVDLFTTAALANGHVRLVEDSYIKSYLDEQKLSGKARIQTILKAAVIRDYLFFHYLHGLKAAAERIDAKVSQTSEGLREIEFDLVKLMLLPGVDPKAELLQLAEFCRRLKQLAEAYPQWRLSLNCGQPRWRRRKEAPPVYEVSLSYNPMDKTGRNLDLEDSDALANVRRAIEELPAVSHFFSKLSATTLRRKFFSVKVELDELFQFGRSPHMRHLRKVAEKGK